MGIFSDIKTAKPTLSSVYLQPGVSEVEILQCKSGKKRIGGVGFFVVELKVIKSSNEAMPPGHLCSWMVTLNNDPALGNIKTFLAVANGINLEEDPEAIDEAGAEEVCSAANPLKGYIMRASASNIKTKANKDFTKVAWELLKEAA